MCYNMHDYTVGNDSDHTKNRGDEMGLPSLLRSKPLLALLISLLIGFFFGWLVMGYIIWPVQYSGQAHSYELTTPEKEQYVSLVADSFKLTGNAKNARDALSGWDNGEIRMTLANLDATLKNQGRTDEAKRVEDLGAALGLPAEAPAVAGARPPAATTPQAAAPFSLGSLVTICVGFIIIVLAVAAVLFVIDRQRRKGGRTTPARSTAEKPGAKSELTSPALGRFDSKYTLGDDSFDESFTIETGAGEFLGECGIGISEMVESGPPDRVTAFELWLFDKSDIRTVTKVLMSEFAYNEPVVRDKLAPKGDAVMTTPGSTIQLETASLNLQARITDLRYGSDSQYPNSYFENLAIEITATPKV
jgi:hypothetical protein